MTNGTAVRTDAPKPLSELRDEQAIASSPDADIWLSASAGTGKTYVLAARVWRLLLRGARADSILCLTFTRAGAAEMAERVHSRLASWAMLDGGALKKELFALGEDDGPAAVAKARTLFAHVLEARGGGLRVMTIHAFCQTLLGSFPLEAGLAPGFRAIEGREQAALADRVLGDLAREAERSDRRLIAALSALSRRLGEDGTRSFLLRASKGVEALESLPEGIEASVRRALDVPADFTNADLVEACDEDNFDQETLFELGQLLSDWGKTGEKRANIISDWFHGEPAVRAAELGKLDLVWNKADGDPRTGKGQVPTDPAYEPLAMRMRDWCGALLTLQRKAALATDIAHALYAARRYARAYADAKRAAGVVDFDDLIAKTVELLKTDGMGAWIGFKLDQATDHILVDESQDTNRQQWQIVDTIVDEFWAEAREDAGRLRTLFTVGDYKQAIFGFQGTDPTHYAEAGNAFDAKARLAGRQLVRLSLDSSFRSTPPVLEIVDALIEDLGAEALGLPDAAEPHHSASGGPGCVTLLPPLRVPPGDDEDGEEGWVPSATRHLASELAKQVKRWLDAPLMLEAQGRPLRASDVMILVRKRSDLAALLVARLYKEGVPVAGVDRLRLAAPLAVKDCMAAVRFAVQPDDDLNLASLLVSPICGWTQDDLYDAAHVKRAGSLWRHLRETVEPVRIDVPRLLLRMADFVSPFVFLETLLSGEIGARANILRRLGNEAADPIDELLNAALDFEREGPATLQGFIDWFDRGDGELKRDPGEAGDAVRVMTVHAAKGLESALVILADATGDPERSADRDFEWVLDETVVPLFRPRGAERQLVDSLEAMAIHRDARERREHWRLLYVAMTRAQERLVIAGSLTERQKTTPEDSWHAAIERAMMRRGIASTVDPHWGDVRVHQAGGRPVSSEKDPSSALPAFARPDWLDRPAPPEARPPRPLAPSSLGPDLVADPPPSDAMKAAAERGRLLHALFERLPQSADRAAAAHRWLATSAGLTDMALRDELVAAALGVIDDPAYAHLFAEGLAEVPIAGVVDGVVVSGTVDRIVVGADTVDVIDFKTGRRVPASLATVPDHHKRQMAAYAAVLRGVFPGKAVRASLLYTSGPRLFALDDAELATHKPGFAPPQDILPVTG